MKAILITLVLVGFLTFMAHRELKRQTSRTQYEVSEITRKTAEQKSRERTQRSRESQRRIVDILPAGKNMNSPFIERMKQELGQDGGRLMASPLDILQTLRKLSIDEVKMLNRQLLSRFNDSQTAGLYPLIEASNLILLEADPLFILNDEGLRKSFYDMWAQGASTAFQSLLRKDPEVARNYFEDIPLEDFKSDKWPFTKIYREMMGYFFAHDPEAAVKFYQRAEKRGPYLPREGSRGQLSSMDQVMPYAELLRSKPFFDPSVSSLIRWASKEAERLGGLDGLARFTKSWTGSEKSEAEQWSFFLSQKTDIRNREGADQLMEFLAENGQSETTSHLWDLAQDWSGIDLKSASSWIEEQPSGPARDRMLEGLLSGLIWADEAAAERWIPLIHDDTTRARYLDAIEKREAPYPPQND